MKNIANKGCCCQAHKFLNFLEFSKKIWDSKTSHKNSEKKLLPKTEIKCHRGHHSQKN